MPCRTASSALPFSPHHIPSTSRGGNSALPCRRPLQVILTSFERAAASFFANPAVSNDVQGVTSTAKTVNTIVENTFDQIRRVSLFCRD